ncbi:AAA family ATPase [Kitasatospora sp. NBC_01266]|uniref:AAA family ATPase n=1 Tax=Kitasatospora sp. NBC_01266 TaxID=2903572 RepID=UPI002E36BF13|nr:AAA family ATPase [Kitasatospora sp. NBC_01266]
MLAELASTAERGVVVNSPPGAGKSTLVVRAAAHLVAQGEKLVIVAQTNEQVDDLTDRLANAQPRLGIGRLHKQDYRPPPRVTRHCGVSGSSRVADLAGLPVVIAPAAKWARVKDFTRSWAIVDEAYQMRSDLMLQTARIFQRGLFVGDPGQLDPFATVETDRWAGLSWNPLLNAVDVILAHNPGIPVHQLPISWRLPASAVPLVGRAFYPFDPFDSGTAPGDRRLVLDTRGLGRSPVDQVLDKAAATGWGFLELPHRHTLPTDRELAGSLVELVVRLIQRGAHSFSAPDSDGRRLTPERICIGTARTNQAEMVRALLPAEYAAVTVATANRLQGREFDVTLVWHPLSGRADAGAFHLETGRLCVLLSRHRQACLVVGRGGMRELLDRYPSTTPVHLNMRPKFPDGWRAHQGVLEQLCQDAHRVKIG